MLGACMYVQFLNRSLKKRQPQIELLNLVKINSNISGSKLFHYEFFYLSVLIYMTQLVSKDVYTICLQNSPQSSLNGTTSLVILKMLF